VSVLHSLLPRVQIMWIKQQEVDALQHVCGNAFYNVSKKSRLRFLIVFSQWSKPENSASRKNTLTISKNLQKILTLPPSALKKTLPSYKH